jgi:hypothetical protein
VRTAERKVSKSIVTEISIHSAKVRRDVGGRQRPDLLFSLVVLLAGTWTTFDQVRYTTDPYFLVSQIRTLTGSWRRFAPPPTELHLIFADLMSNPAEAKPDVSMPAEEQVINLTVFSFSALSRSKA